MKNLFKKILCLLALCGFAAHAHAQYVTIPDANFRTFLQGQYPQCFNAQGEMDTTCNAVVTATSMDCSGRNIASLEGVQYFDGLDTLFCYSNQLTNLPVLPYNLRVAFFDDNQLTSISSLPNSLTDLSCYYNRLTSLSNLPSNLAYLRCDRNLLTGLPTLPANLKIMNCSGNQLTNLPNIPINLTSLECQYNRLITLPVLPNTLEYLDGSHNLLNNLPSLSSNLIYLVCEYNQLTSAPSLPSKLHLLNVDNNQLATLPILELSDSLKILYCGTNHLTSLPILPHNLEVLGCGRNQLTNLPILPSSLTVLACTYNRLSILPSLPGRLVTLNCGNNQLENIYSLPNTIIHLLCDNNPISCLPFLPNSLEDLQIYNTSINCIANRPVNLIIQIPNQNTPLCTPNNLNGCLSAARIFGKAYTDTDNNCTVTALDNLQQNLLVKAVNTSTQQVYVGTSDANGLYEIAVPVGNYAVSVVEPSVYWTACGSGQTVVITQDGQQEQRDVLIKPEVPCADMAINHQVQNLARPCSTAVYKVSYFNQGTIASSGTYADITLPTELTLLSATLPYTVLGGNTFRFQLGSVAALQRDTFSLSANVNCAATMGLMLCTHAEVQPHTFCNAGLSGWDGSDVAVTGRCVGQDSVRFILANTGNGGMTTGRTYGVVEDNVMIRSSTFQLPAGASDSITIAADPHRIYRIIADESLNNPAQNTQETFLIWGCNGLNGIHWGFVNQYNLNTGADFEHDLCTPVRTSFDPNDISAVAEGVGAQHFIPKNTDLEYKIRFQNTGNDTAFVVRIIDKIPAELDLTTLRVGAASHPMTYSLKANGTLEFLFQNIKLEDSTSNEPKSHGFVTYKIKTQPNSATGDIINNQAFIYFDANAPVATNIYTHTIGENLSTIFTNTLQVIDNQAFSVSVNPNPMHDATIFNVQSYRHLEGIDNLNPELTLYNTLGQTVKTQRFTNEKLILQRDDLPQGCYFYTITTDGQRIAQGRLVVQ